jgi:hypothetical protein
MAGAPRDWGARHAKRAVSLGMAHQAKFHHLAKEARQLEKQL